MSPRRSDARCSAPLSVCRARTGRPDDHSAYLEELIVRRELAINFVHFHPDYDRYACLPDWARNTLLTHRGDERDPTYSLKQLETAATHDRYWNAAMREMVTTGFMHNYMRMYWAKKILEWTPEPEVAYRRTLYLNNRYFLDGRDPNSYANVAWVFGLHDRPWPERPIFGKVRSMTARGLERKSIWRPTGSRSTAWSRRKRAERLGAFELGRDTSQGSGCGIASSHVGS
jgi:deoxyribodipyrimidine photo-lyase